MIRILGRLVLIAIITVVLIFGGMLALTTSSSNACDNHRTVHHYPYRSIDDPDSHYSKHHYRPIID